MKLPIRGRTLGLLAILVPLLALFVWVVLRAGPLAPVTVRVSFSGSVSLLRTANLTALSSGVPMTSARATGGVLAPAMVMLRTALALPPWPSVTV